VNRGDGMATEKKVARRKCSLLELAVITPSNRVIPLKSSGAQRWKFLA